MRKPSIILYSNSDKEFDSLEFWKVNLNAHLVGQWTGNGDEIRIHKNYLDGQKQLVNKATFDDIANEIISRLCKKGLNDDLENDG